MLRICEDRLMSIRKLAVETVSLLANTETEWTPPNGSSLVEIQIDNTSHDVRMAFEAGETATSGEYWNINPDWWNPGGKQITLPESHTFYFRCVTSTNTVRILIGIE